MTLSLRELTLRVYPSAIRVVDDKAILYLEAPNTSAALTWVKSASFPPLRF